MPQNQTFKEIFTALGNGNSEEISRARKLLKNVKCKNVIDSSHWTEVASVLEEFSTIKNPKNKAAVISGLNIFFLRFGDDYFNILKEFTLKNLTDSNGHVREAMRHTADWLYISLSSRIHPFIYESEKLPEKQRETQREAEQQYIALIKEIESLLENYDDGKSEDIEYIDDMKPSVYKSLQMFWSRLTESDVYRRIQEKQTPITLEVMLRRKAAETAVASLLKQSQSHFCLDDVKRAIFEEEGHDDFHKIISMLDTGTPNAAELSTILEALTGAWNYFPHRSLGGLSPAQITSQ